MLTFSKVKNIHSTTELRDEIFTHSFYYFLHFVALEKHTFLPFSPNLAERTTKTQRYEKIWIKTYLWSI